MSRVASAIVFVTLLLAPEVRAAGGSAANVAPQGPPVGSKVPATFAVSLDRETLVEGLKLPKGTVLHFDEGAITPALKGSEGRPAPYFGPATPTLDHVVPVREIAAWGFPIAANEDLFLGAFVSLVLAREASFEGVPLEAGTIVEFERRRGPGEDQPAAIKVMRGYTLGGAATVRGIAFPGSTALEFLPDGTLWRARLFDDEELQNLPISSSADVEFHPNGKIASFRLAHDHDLDGHLCLDETEVTLHSSGALASCFIAPGQSVQGFVADPQRPTTFDDVGRVSSLGLGADALVDGLTLPEGAVLDFHPNGRIKRIRIGTCPAGALKVRGIAITAIAGRDNVGAYFRPDGSLEMIVTGSDFEYEGVPGLAGTVEFWVSGRLKSARLARELKLGGRTYPPRTQIRFKRDGSPARN